MKRIVLGALVLLSTTAALATETERYFVATRRPAREIGVNNVVREPAKRRLSTFTVVHGFAADLTAAEAASLRNSSDVRYVERVVPRYLHAISQPGQQIVPYGVALVKAPEAWEGRLAGAVNVAVIDSGIDDNHPEMQGVWKGGINAVQPDQSTRDRIGHGTHVAGTIGAAHNRLGVVGVAPHVSLWAIKAFADNGTGSMEDVLEGIDWVVAKKKAEGGRWVVNISAGGPENSTAEGEAFARAAAEGIVVVASSGNESKADVPAPVSFPAAYPSVVAVGAVDEQSRYANFSNQGPELDFVAPGVRVVSLSLHGDDFLSYIRTATNEIFETKPLVGAKREAVTGTYINCGLGTPADFGPAVQGKIALIQRGGDTFADKVRRAKEAGALAAVIYNNADSSFYWTLYPAEDPDAQNYPWPVAVGMSQADGEALAAKGSGVITIGYDFDDYSVRSGTSMSAPHVTGAIAHLWALAPAATPDQIFNALAMTAKDVGTVGKDNETGHGLIDVNAAARMLAPSAFGRTGRRFLRRH